MAASLHERGAVLGVVVPSVDGRLRTSDQGKNATLAGTLLERFERHVRRWSMPAGNTLYEVRDPAPFLFVVDTGRVELTRYTKDGTEILYAEIGPGAFFGEDVYIGERLSNAKVTGEGEAVAIPRDYLGVVCQEWPMFDTLLHTTQAERERKFADRIEELQTRWVIQRLAGFCDMVADEDGKMPQFTQQQIGRLIGATRESVNKQTGFLQKNGFLISDGEGLRVNPMRREELRRIVTEERSKVLSASSIERRPRSSLSIRDRNS